MGRIALAQLREFFVSEGCRVLSARPESESGLLSFKEATDKEPGTSDVFEGRTTYERAAKLLEEQATGPETEVLWMSLCNQALDDVNLDLAERCWDRLNNTARAEFLRKTLGPQCPLVPQTPTSSASCSGSSVGSSGSCLADSNRHEHTGSEPVSTVQPPTTNTSSSGSEGIEHLFLMDPEQKLDEDEAVDLLKSHGFSDRKIHNVLHLLFRTSGCSSTQNAAFGSETNNQRLSIGGSSLGSKGEFLMDPEQELDEDEAVVFLKSQGLSDGRIREVFHQLSSTQNGVCEKEQQNIACRDLSALRRDKRPVTNPARPAKVAIGSETWIQAQINSFTNKHLECDQEARYLQCKFLLSQCGACRGALS